MKYQAFLHHFASVGGWLKGSWAGLVCVGVGGGGVVGGVGRVLVRDGWVYWCSGGGWCVVGWGCGVVVWISSWVWGWVVLG